MKAIKILLITVAFLAFTAYPATAKKIYVSSGQSIQSDGIDQASDGDTIIVKAGTFEESLTIDGFKKLKIIGAGEDNSIIDGTNISETLVSITNSTNILIKKFTISNAGAGTGSQYHNIFIDQCDDIKIIKNTISGATGDGIYYGYGLALTIKNNIIHNNQLNGIHFHGHSNENVISNNHITDNSNKGIYHYYGNDDLIEDNEVSSNSDEGIYNEYGFGLKILKNKVEENGGYGICDDSYGGLTNVIKKNTVKSNGSYGIYVYQGIKVIKNTVTGNSSYGIYGSDCGNVILHNVVKDNTGYGIHLDYAGRIEGNTVDGNDSYGIYCYGYGVEVLNNTCTGNGGSGIFNDYDVCVISGNYCNNNGGEGIAPYYDSVIVTNNVSTNNGNYGIYCDDYSNMISGNVVKGNASDGIGGWCSYCVIKNNKVKANEGCGINNLRNCIVKANTVKTNLQDGINAAGNSGNLIKGNKSLSNGDGTTFFDLTDDTPPDDFWKNNTYNTSSW